MAWARRSRPLPNGSTVIAGTESTVNTGAVYVFVKPTLGWTDVTENAKLTASDGAAADDLGSSLAISSDGSTIVAGAPNAKVSSATNQGAVYIFDKPSGGWATAFAEHEADRLRWRREQQARRLGRKLLRRDERRRRGSGGGRAPRASRMSSARAARVQARSR